MIEKQDSFLGIEVRHLAALDAIARTRSFSQAAAELGYAQSAISQQIATLERAVGHKLVERPGGPRPVSLTEAGELLLRHAEQITARLGAVKADLDALGAGESGTLRIGTFQSASARLLPSVLSRFRAGWPGVDVNLRNEGDVFQLGGLVRSGHLDLAFSELAGPGDPLAGIDLIVDPYIAIVPRDSPFADNDELDLADLDGVDLIAQSPRDACGIRIEQAFGAVRVAPRNVYRTDDNLTAQRLVACGLGCALMPLLAVEYGVPDADVAVLPLTERCAFSRTIALVWHPDRYRSRAADAFIEIAAAVAAEVVAARALSAV
jgi:DNA-binding transcriptional LysR family regulator